MAASALERGLLRTPAGDETWWMAARTLSGMLPRMGRRTAAAITEGITDAKKQKTARGRAEAKVL